MLKILGDIAMIAATSSFVAFVILYNLLAKWRASRMGRHVMTFMLIVAITLLYVIFATVFLPPLQVRLIVRLVIYGLLAVVGWRQVAILVQEQHRARKDTIDPGRHKRLKGTRDGSNDQRTDV